MKLIICVDVDNGMTFNNRRQSRDREVIKDIVRYIGDDILYISEYSKILFDDVKANIVVNANDKHKANEYYYIEKSEDLDSITIDEVDELILYRWDKKYPSDYKMNIDLNNYTLISILDFQGYSHEKITREVYKYVK